MFHFFNKKLENKSTRFFLIKILGVGFFLAAFYCKKLGICPSSRFSALSSKQRVALEYQIIKDQKNLKQEKLVQAVSNNIVVLMRIKSFNGVLHKKRKNSRNSLK